MNMHRPKQQSSSLSSTESIAFNSQGQLLFFFFKHIYKKKNASLMIHHHDDTNG